jgi:hypothetical protein
LRTVAGEHLSGFGLGQTAELLSVVTTRRVPLLLKKNTKTTSTASNRLLQYTR